MLLFAMKTALTEEAYRLGNKLYFKTAKNATLIRVLWIVLFALTGINLVGSVILAVMWQAPVAPDAYVIPVGLAVMYAIVPLMRRSAVRNAICKYRTIGKFTTPETLCFYDDRIECTGAGGVFTCTWAQIDRMVESETLFLIVSGAMLIHIDAHRIDEPAFSYLRKLLVQKCGGWKIKVVHRFVPVGYTELPEGVALDDRRQPVSVPSQEAQSPVLFTQRVPAQTAYAFTVPLLLLEGLVTAVSVLAGVILYFSAENGLYSLGTGLASWAVCQLIVVAWGISSRKKRAVMKDIVLNWTETEVAVFREGQEMHIPLGECCITCGKKRWLLTHRQIFVVFLPTALLTEEAAQFIKTHCTVQ